MGWKKTPFGYLNELTSNNMELTCILGASWATQTEVEQVFKHNTMTIQDFDHMV
jgi:hypothetical protein